MECLKFSTGNTPKPKSIQPKNEAVLLPTTSSHLSAKSP